MADDKVQKEDLVMAYVINDDCVSCGACVSECPVDAISEGPDKYVIDADKCIDCGACASACPSDAIAQA
jgi:ferredoxin